MESEVFIADNDVNGELAQARAADTGRHLTVNVLLAKLAGDILKYLS